MQDAGHTTHDARLTVPRFLNSSFRVPCVVCRVSFIIVFELYMLIDCLTNGLH